MAKKQTRRSISIKGTTYRRLATLCERNGRSVSNYIEELIEPWIIGIDDPGTPPKPKKPEPEPEPNPEDIASGIFSF